MLLRQIKSTPTAAREIEVLEGPQRCGMGAAEVCDVPANPYILRFASPS